VGDLECTGLLDRAIHEAAVLAEEAFAAALVDLLHKALALEAVEVGRAHAAQEERAIALFEQDRAAVLLRLRLEREVAAQTFSLSHLADVLEDLDDGLEEANVENRQVQLDVSVMARAVCQLLAACGARAQLGRDTLKLRVSGCNNGGGEPYEVGVQDTVLHGLASRRVVQLAPEDLQLGQLVHVLRGEHSKLDASSVRTDGRTDEEEGCIRTATWKQGTYIFFGASDTRTWSFISPSLFL